jgi:hypothetical protein
MAGAMIHAEVGILAAMSTTKPFPPQRLAIYYGWPSGVNGAQSVEAAAAVFADYQRVVFGWGLQDKSHGDHRNTAAIIAALAERTRVYGYIPLGEATGLSPRQVKKAAKLWRKLGVGGVLLDEAGYDYGNTRKRQNQCLDAVRSQGLSPVLNAWKPSDLLSTFPGQANPKGEPLALAAGDGLLYESYRVREGQLEEDQPWRDKIDGFARRPAGVELWGVSTTTPGAGDPHWPDYLVFCAILDGLDVVGWGEPEFSAPDNALPPRAWPDLPPIGEIRLEGEVVPHGSAYARQTSLGLLRVDPTTTPAGSFQP